MARNQQPRRGRPHHRRAFGPAHPRNGARTRRTIRPRRTRASPRQEPDERTTRHHRGTPRRRQSHTNHARPARRRAVRPAGRRPPLGAMDGRSARRNARRRGAQGLQPRPNRPLAPPRRQPRHRNTGEHPPPMPRHARRPARPHEPGRQPPPPSHDGEGKRRRQARHPKESPPASGRRTGTAPGGQRGSRRPFANPGRPTPPDPTQTPRPARRDDGETGEALSDEGAAPPACPLPGCQAPKGAIIASRPRPRRGHGTIPPHGTRPKGRAGPFLFLFGRSASPLDHTGVAEPVNAPRNGLRPA